MPPYGCSGEWASISTINQGAALGAQFITFNAGDPKEALGYFKNVNGQTIDNVHHHRRPLKRENGAFALRPPFLLAGSAVLTGA